MKTVHQIIDETVDFYRTNPRSLNHGQCLYRGPNGERCALSRCVVNVEKLIEKLRAKDNIAMGKAIFFPEYEGHPPSFWNSLQDLHDKSWFWVKNDSSGQDLSSKGEEFVRELKLHYIN